MKSTILIVDDDEKLNGLLTDYLDKFGYDVTAVALPSLGLEYLRSANPALAILDVMLPEMDGFELCRTIRKTSEIPIIMLTARGDVTDRVVGLEIGADDYLSKPFEPRELAARVQSVLRRSREAKPISKLSFENLEIDLNRREAVLEGAQVDLTTAEFELLALLASNSGEILDRDRIMEKVRGIEWESFNRSVDVLVSRLRQKLGDDPKSPRFIKTVWGTGYRFISERV